MENPIIDHKITIFIGGNYHPQMVCTQMNPGGRSHEVGSATWLNPWLHVVRVLSPVTGTRLV